MARSSSHAKAVKHFIAGAIKRPGALRAKAQRAGQSTMAFARKHDSGNSRTAKQARFAEFLNKVRPRKGRR